MLRLNSTKWLQIHPPPSSLTCSVEGDPPGGGGDGGPPAALTPEMEALIGRTVNAAVSSQLGRKLSAAVGDAVGSALTPFQEQMAALAPKPPPTGGGAGDSEMANRVKALEAQNREMAENAKRQAAEHAEAQLKGNLRRALGDRNVRPELLDGAVATLRGQVTTADGNSFFRKDRGGYHEDLPIEKGIEEWLASDQGKAHLAPLDVGGSGANGSRGSGPRPGNTPLTKEQIRAQRLQKARSELRSGMASLVGGASVTIGGGKGE